MADSISSENWSAPAPEKGQLALGNDLVFLPSFRQSCTELFKRKVYSVEEAQYCEAFSDPTLRYASTFAAKEAAYKALKQLFSKGVLPWRSMQILRDGPSKRPFVRHPLLDRFCKHSLTISHDGDYVWASIAVVTQGEQACPPICPLLISTNPFVQLKRPKK